MISSSASTAAEEIRFFLRGGSEDGAVQSLRMSLIFETCDAPSSSGTFGTKGALVEILRFFVLPTGSSTADVVSTERSCGAFPINFFLFFAGPLYFAKFCGGTIVDEAGS